MNPLDPQQRRPDLRKSLSRDVSRRRRREAGHGSFWRSIGVLGMVGWPIAMGAAGGALLGHWLDHHFASGVRYTLIFLTLGVTVGCLAAWRAIRRR